MLEVFSISTTKQYTVMKTYAILKKEKKNPSISIKLGICYHVWQCQDLFFPTLLLQQEAGRGITQDR